MKIAARRPACHRMIAVVLLSVTVGLGACAGSDTTPEQARRDRVETRLRETFTKSQASCILGLSDDRLLTALDKKADLAGDDAIMEAYTNAIVACVAGTDDKPLIGSTTTSGPDGTTP